MKNSTFLLLFPGPFLLPEERELVLHGVVGHVAPLRQLVRLGVHGLDLLLKLPERLTEGRGVPRGW